MKNIIFFIIISGAISLPAAAHDYYLKGLEYYKNADYSRALSSFEAAMFEDANKLDYVYAYALAAFMLKRYAEVRDICQNIINNPASDETNRQRASILLGKISAKETPVPEIPRDVPGGFLKPQPETSAASGLDGFDAGTIERMKKNLEEKDQEILRLREEISLFRDKKKPRQNTAGEAWYLQEKPLGFEMRGWFGWMFFTGGEAGREILTSDGILKKNKAVFFSEGTGTIFGLDTVFSFKNNFGLELGGSYLLGESKKIYYHQQIISVYSAEYTITSRSTLIPLFAGFSVSTKNRISLRASLGALFPVKAETAINENYTYNTFKETVESRMLYKSYPGWGASLGMVINLFPHFALSLQIKGMSLFLKIRRLEILKYISNNIDITDTLKTIDKVTVFSDYSESTDNNGLSANTNPDRPDWGGPAYYVPFTSLGINIGLSLRL
ncbi:MAG: hypothetical protein A2096_00160 [Spirochaetes bacterium GWF1_41_5]|nr:MAG: hypothetical protein A2096_00160 [Spirochaetes bacterium GWF1_41_5]HBE03694.1 hypothetical protein [Spirochaetia bacterium]